MFGMSGANSDFPVTYGSKTVNGQLVPVFQWQPLSSGNAVGPAFGGGPASPATVPPNASRGGAAASSAARQPFSLKNSAVPLLLIMLVVGVLGLRYVHWRR